MCFRGGVETLAPTPGRCESFPGLLAGPQGKALMCTSTGVHRALYWRGGKALQEEEYPEDAFLLPSFLISQTGSLNPCNFDICDGSLGAL